MSHQVTALMGSSFRLALDNGPVSLDQLYREDAAVFVSLSFKRHTSAYNALQRSPGPVAQVVRAHA
jgi:hypothetical protein